LNRGPPAPKECSEVPDFGDFRVEYGPFARSYPVRRRSITVLNRSARCNRDAKRVALRCGASLPHADPQLRTSKTVLGVAGYHGGTSCRLLGREDRGRRLSCTFSVSCPGAAALRASRERSCEARPAVWATDRGLCGPSAMGTGIQSLRNLTPTILANSY